MRPETLGRQFWRCGYHSSSLLSGAVQDHNADGKALQSSWSGKLKKYCDPTPLRQLSRRNRSFLVGHSHIGLDCN